VSSEPTATERLRWLGGTASRWTLAIVLLVVAVLVGASWTLGLFTSSSANPKNTVSAGSMTQDNSADNAAIMGATEMLPGEVVEGSATIENVGDAPGDFTLRVKDVSDEAGPNGGLLASWLRLEVYDEGATPIWVGPLRELDVGLGKWQPGDKHTYRFEVTFPEQGPAVDNTFQRSRATATFEWNAAQSH
jgi:hypothetical protein